MNFHEIDLNSYVKKLYLQKFKNYKQFYSYISFNKVYSTIDGED